MMPLLPAAAAVAPLPPPQAPAACDPDPQAVQAFQSALAAPPAAAPAAVAAPAAGGTLGDTILGGLRRAQGDYRQTLDSVSRSVAAAGTLPSMPEMLRMQLGLAQLSVQVELTGKLVSRSTQNIDQLVRMQ